MKHFTLFFLFLFSCYGIAQEMNPNNYKTPNGLLDRIFDNYGTAMQLHDIEVSPKTKADGTIITSELLDTVGIFELYYEQGSGMELVNDTEHLARRSLIIKVFTDISNFLITPLKNSGNTQKVKIWIRDYEQVQELLLEQVSYGSSYYNVPSDVANIASISDNQLWKTINSGKDAFTNVSNIHKDEQNLIQFYHATFAFDFSNQWNTDISTLASSNQYDLYTYALREIVHSLGFISLIDQEGSSKFGSENKFYSRFDTFLKNQKGNNLIISNGENSPMHNIEFQGEPNDLFLSCTNSPTDYMTDCSNSIQFAGTNTTILYTPNCFNTTTSFNLINGGCYNPNSFLMSDTVNQGVTIRNMTGEERSILNDIGYSFNATYADSNDFYFKDYATELLAENVVGINDGFDNTNYYYGATNENLNIINLLTNDYGNTILFESLKDTNYSNTGLSINSGSNNDVVTMDSPESGFHLLSYVPYSSNTGKRGNITYAFVYLRNNCAAQEEDCNLIKNGDFETSLNNGIPNNFAQFGSLVCQWRNGNASPEYCHLSSPHPFISNQTPNSSGGQACAGIICSRVINIFGQFAYLNELITTTLTSPLEAGADYRLTYQISNRAPGVNLGARMQAYLGFTNLPTPTTLGNFLVEPNGILLNTQNIINNSIGWDDISIDFNSGSGGQYVLSIGGYNNLEIIGSPSNMYYYIDNVKLEKIQNFNPQLTLPSPLCSTDTSIDLNNYLTNGVSGGYFSINGDSLGGNIFDPSSVGVGTHTISYTIPSPIACPEIVVSGTIVVNQCVTPPYISQVYKGKNSNRMVEIKNTDNTNSITPGMYYLALYTGGNTTTPTFIMDVASGGNIAPSGVKVFKSAMALAPGYVVDDPTFATVFGNLENFDGVEDLLILSTSNDSNTFANRKDIIGDTTTNSIFYKEYTLDTYPSLVRVSCTPEGFPRAEYDEQDWVGFSLDEVDDEFSKTNSVLGRHYSEELTWTFNGWDDASPTESNPDRSRAVKISFDYTTSFATSTNQPSFEACSLIVTTSNDLTITPSTYTKVQTSVTVTDANAKLIIEDQGSLVMARDTYYDVAGTDLVNLGANSTMSVDRTTVGINGPRDYVFWSSPLSSNTTNTTADQIFNFTGTNLQPAPYNHHFDPYRFYLFENKNFYDELNIHGDNGNGTDGYDDNYDNVFDPLVDDYVPFTALPSAVNQQLIPGRGYNTMPPIGTPFNTPSSYTVKFKGEMNNGIVTVPVYANNSQFGLDPNLVGNPYPSPIDLNLFLYENSEIIKPYALIWGRQGLNGNGDPVDINDNPNNSNSGYYALNYNEDNYMVYNPYMSLLPNSFTNNLAFNPQGLLASCQSFFVFAKDEEPVGNEEPIYNTGVITEVGTVSFSNKMRSTLPNITFAKSNSLNSLSGGDKLWVNLTDTNNYTAQLGICFNEFATADYSINEDVQTTQGRKYNFYTQSTTEDLIIDVQDIFTDDKEIPLGILNNSDNQNQSFTISIPQKSGIFNTQDVYLEDLQLNVLHNLSQSGYSFTTAGTIVENRFKLRFTNNNTNFALKSIDNQVQISLNDNEVVVNSNSIKIKSIEVSDIYVVNSYGFKVHTKENINANTSSFTIDKKHKLLNFKITLEDGTIINKKMAR